MQNPFIPPLPAIDRSHELFPVVQLTRSGKPFALFLRSFDAERAGLKHSNDQLTSQAYEDQFAMDLSGTLPPVRDYADVWTVQRAIVWMLAKRLPTVQLGDHPSLHERLMTSSLSSSAATPIRVGSETWWMAFELLAQHARIIVVLVDVPSPSLVKEVAHLRSHNLRHICAQRQDASGSCGDATMGFRDHSSFDFRLFEEILDEALRA